MPTSSYMPQRACSLRQRSKAARRRFRSSSSSACTNALSATRRCSDARATSAAGHPNRAACTAAGSRHHGCHKQRSRGLAATPTVALEGACLDLPPAARRCSSTPLAAIAPTLPSHPPPHTHAPPPGRQAPKRGRGGRARLRGALPGPGPRRRLPRRMDPPRLLRGYRLGARPGARLRRRVGAPVRGRRDRGARDQLRGGVRGGGHAGAVADRAGVPAGKGGRGWLVGLSVRMHGQPHARAGSRCNALRHA